MVSPSITDARPTMVSALLEAAVCTLFGNGNFSKRPGPKYPAAPATAMAARIVGIPPALREPCGWKLTTLLTGRWIPLIVRWET